MRQSRCSPPHRQKNTSKRTASFTADYALYTQLKHLYPRYHISGLEENYASAVEVRGQIPASESGGFKADIYNASKGKTIVEVTQCI